MQRALPFLTPEGLTLSMLSFWESEATALEVTRTSAPVEMQAPVTDAADTVRAFGPKDHGYIEASLDGVTGWTDITNTAGLALAGGAGALVTLYVRLRILHWGTVESPRPIWRLAVWAAPPPAAYLAP